MARFIDSALADSGSGRACGTFCACGPKPMSPQTAADVSGSTARIQSGNRDSLDPELESGSLSLDRCAPRRLIIQTGWHPAWHLQTTEDRWPAVGSKCLRAALAQRFHFGLDGFPRAKSAPLHMKALVPSSAPSAPWLPPPTPYLRQQTSSTASTRPPPYQADAQSPSHPIPVPSPSPPFPQPYYRHRPQQILNRQLLADNLVVPFGPAHQD